MSAELPVAGTTLVVAGAGFSVGAGQPLTRDILKIAATREEQPFLASMVSAVDKLLRHKRFVIDKPLVEFDIEDLLLSLA